MSSNSRLGAMPYGGGVNVNVWSPNASTVALRWLNPARPDVALAQGAGGTWSAGIAGMSVGDVYVYVITSGQLQWLRVDPYSQHAFDSAAGDATASVVYDESAYKWRSENFTSPGWTELVVYELHVGSFNPAPGQPVGTFDDVIAKLGYLSDLGVNAIELLPVIEFQGNISWGYDPGVPFSVAHGYGGPDGLKRLVDAAAAHGIVVILDVVYNHLGPPDSVLWQFDGSGPTWEGGIYFYGSRWPNDGRPNTPWGSRPDYGRPEVRQYLCDNALQWLEDYRVGGLRFDATAYIRSVDGSGDPSQDIPDGWLLLQQINDAIDATQSWKVTIAEDMRGNTAITSPTASGGAGFDSQWDSNFLYTLRGVVEAVDDSDRDMGALAGAIGDPDSPSATGRVIFTESHDADGNGRTRVPTEIDPGQPDSWWSKKRSTLAAAVAFTAPGIPMVFQGQEFLEQQAFLLDPSPPTWANVIKYAGILQLYKDLVHLRRNTSGLSRGLCGDGVNVFHVNSSAKVVAFHRYDQGGPHDDVVIVANFANQSYTAYTFGAPRGGIWKVRFNSDWDGYDPGYANTPCYDTLATGAGRDGLSYSATIGIGPYTAVILSQDD